MKQEHKKANQKIYSMKAQAGSLFVRLSAGVGIALVLSLLAFTLASNANNSTAGRSNVTEPPASAIAQETSAGPRVEVELVTIKSSGFHPSEITRPPGSFILAVENRSGLDQVELMLDREAGDRLHQAQVQRRKPNWHQRLDLAPGRYVLTEASDPEWKCYINITGR